MAKFGVLKQTQGLHLHAKFHLNVFIVSASGGQKHNFGQILTYWGLLYRPPFADEGQIWCAVADLYGVRLRAEFCLDQFILSPSVGKKQFCRFWTLAFSVVAMQLAAV